MAGRSFLTSAATTGLGVAFITRGTGNGDSLGRGNASVWNDFVLSLAFYYACEITHTGQLQRTARIAA